MIFISNSKTMRLVTGGLELFLAIPILGGLIVIGFAYVPLLIMLALHITTLVLTKQEDGPAYGSIVGIVTSCVAWIPFLGWSMHLLSGILLLLSIESDKKKNIIN